MRPRLTESLILIVSRRRTRPPFSVFTFADLTSWMKLNFVFTPPDYQITGLGLYFRQAKFTYSVILFKSSVVYKIFLDWILSNFKLNFNFLSQKHQKALVCQLNDDIANHVCIILCMFFSNSLVHNIRIKPNVFVEYLIRVWYTWSRQRRARLNLMSPPPPPPTTHSTHGWVFNASFAALLRRILLWE